MIAVKSSIPEIVDWLDVEKLHVHAPSDAVLVCGGQQDPKSDRALSLRDAFLKVTFNPPLSRLRFRLAEETSVDRKASAYSDWMNFEADLAQICQLIVLFCESPGAIAELALFVTIDEIAGKLVVIVDSENNAEDSYVKLGPIAAFVEAYGKDKRFLLNLPDVGIEKLSQVKSIDLNALRKELENFIFEEAQKNQEPRSFIRERSGHKIKLVTGLIQHYGALTEEELDVLLWALSLPMTNVELRQYLQCAEFLRWVKLEERGQREFWVPLEAKDAIEYAMKDGAPTLNKAAWKARVRQYWRDRDPPRFSAINANQVKVVL